MDSRKKEVACNQVFSAWTAVLQMNKHLLKCPGQQQHFYFHESQNAKKLHVSLTHNLKSNLL